MAGMRGGRRPGAGRKKAATTRVSRKIADAVATDGRTTPLEYVIKLMRNPRADKSRRDWAAAQALPYVHPKLMSIQGDPEKPIVHEHRIGTMDAARRVALVLFMADNANDENLVIEHEPVRQVKG